MSNHDQRSMYESERDVRAENNPPPEIVQKPRQQVVQKPKQQAGSDQPSPKRGKTIAIVAAILLLAAAGIAAVLIFNGGKGKGTPEAKTDTADELLVKMEAEAKVEGMPKYLSDYDPESDLGKAHASTRVKLDGETYVLPCPVQTFLDNGWEIDADSMDVKDYVVAPTKADDEDEVFNFLYLKNDQHERSMLCEVANRDSEQRYVQNCYVIYIQADPECADLEIYGDIHFGSDIRDLEPALQKLPSAAWANINLDDESCFYSDFSDETGFTCSKISFFSEYSNPGIIGSVWVESRDWFWTDGELPTEPNVSAYTAPEELGDDLQSGIVEVGGDLYQLPCPLSAFLDNGWGSYYDEGEAAFDRMLRPMTERDTEIDLQGQRRLYLVRSDSDCWLEIDVSNFANHPIHARDSIVVGVMAFTYDNGTKNDYVVLPGDARIGQSLNSLGLTFNSSGDYMIYERKTETQKVRISGKTDGGVVTQIQMIDMDWKLGYITPDLK